MFKKQTLIALAITIIVIGSISFGAVMYVENKTYKNYLQAQYQMNLYNLLENIKNVQVGLSKATVSQSDGQRAVLFDSISRKAEEAKGHLHNLPISSESISQTSKFLSQVSDYTYTLIKDMNSGSDLNDNVEKTVEELKNYSSYLTLQLQALENEIINERFNWEQIREKGVQSTENEVKDGLDIKFQNISKEMQDYPNLIYDGPFSDKSLNIKPKVLSQKEVSSDMALESAIKYLGAKNIKNIKVTGEVKSDTLPAYSITAEMKSGKDAKVNMDVSKNGANIIYMLNHREIKNDTIGMKEAIKKGNEYLKDKGYPKMIPLYSLKYGNTAIINYAYVKDNIVVYPDQVKLKIALDNGEIVGVEANTYLNHHSENREIKPATIDYKKYQKEISKVLDVKNIRLALIPADSMKEVLCYEYVAEKNGEQYIIYINANTGKEEDILKIIETSNGELTM